MPRQPQKLKPQFCGRIIVRGCLKRVVPGIVCCQEAAKTLSFEDISLRPRYNLKRSLAFQTPS
jgi:hypothetical protein